MLLLLRLRADPIVASTERDIGAYDQLHQLVLLYHGGLLQPSSAGSPPGNGMLARLGAERRPVA